MVAPERCAAVAVQVHLGNHWTCAVVDFRNRCISYFDSLGVRHFAECVPPGVIAGGVRQCKGGVAAWQCNLASSPAGRRGLASTCRCPCGPSSAASLRLRRQ